MRSIALTIALAIVASPALPLGQPAECKEQGDLTLRFAKYLLDDELTLEQAHYQYYFDFGEFSEALEYIYFDQSKDVYSKSFRF